MSDSKKKMNGFKLLAIRPRAECSHHFLKILKADELYKFSNDFGYEFDENKEVINITSLNKIPSNLYLIQTKNRAIDLNISAIVGKNGSGKSSLIELLFMAINNIAKPHIPDNIKPLHNVAQKEGECLDVELYFQTSSIFKIHVKNNYNTEPKVIIYKLINSIFEDYSDEFSLKEFFYSIALNYSSNSLDSRYLGQWLMEVFHKNDSYQTPLVLNPFRNHGHIDYESEKGLTNDRLLTNVLRKRTNDFDFRMLTEKQKVEKISLILNLTNYTKKAVYTEYDSVSGKVKYEVLSEELSHYRRLLFDVLSHKLDFDFNKVDKNKINKKALDYIFYKTFKIAKTYKANYGDLFNFREKKLVGSTNKVKIELVGQYLDELFIGPGSHITNKIRQVVNFLKINNNVKFKEKSILSVEELAMSIDNSIKTLNSKDINRIEFIPPPIYDVDYELVSIGAKETASTTFNLLSSGEKQKINSVNSIVYHLINIDSVIEKHDIIKYNNVNIVFEEIELYFHPDMQRTFVKFLYDTIKNISLKKISSINIILVTHSPFILSDIPHPNILYLDAQQETNKGFLAYPQNKDTCTLGANIYELLSDSFYMNNGFMGEYANSKIKSVIAYLEGVIELQTNPKNIDSSEPISKWTKEQAKSFINLIGEPMLRYSLLDLFHKAFFTNKSQIDAEIARLQKLKITKR